MLRDLGRELFDERADLDALDGFVGSALVDADGSRVDVVVAETRMYGTFSTFARRPPCLLDSSYCFEARVPEVGLRETRDEEEGRFELHVPLIYRLSAGSVRELRQRSHGFRGDGDRGDRPAAVINPWR